MKISFKGFENTGLGVEMNPTAITVTKADKRYEVPKYTHLSLSTKLNNENKNDLEEFALLLKKFPNSNEKDTINFSYDKFYSKTQNKMKKEFWLNDKPLLLCDENLGVFEKLSKLFTRLSTADESDLKIQPTYFLSDECRRNFPYFNKIEDPQEKNLHFFFFHNNENINSNSKRMADEFQKIMQNYFQ